MKTLNMQELRFVSGGDDDEHGCRNITVGGGLSGPSAPSGTIDDWAACVGELMEFFGDFFGLSTGFPSDVYITWPARDPGPEIPPDVC